jgi:hypothetical protein
MRRRGYSGSTKAQPRLGFIQKDVKYMPISPQVLGLCSEPCKPE